MFDKDNWSVYLMFEYGGEDWESGHELEYSPRHNLFYLSEYCGWEEYEYCHESNGEEVKHYNFYESHPDLKREDVLRFLQKWVDENQAHTLRETLKHLPTRVELGNDKGFFAMHCGYQYIGSELKKLLSGKANKKYFKQAYAQTCYRDPSDPSGCRTCFSNFNKTIEMIPDDAWFIGTNSSQEDFQAKFSGFLQLESEGEEYSSNGMVIGFETEPYDLD
jgi:hypothetical protein